MKQNERIQEIILENYTKMSDLELADKINEELGTNFSGHAIKHRRQKMKLAKVAGVKDSGKFEESKKVLVLNTEENFVKFLIKGRTERELATKFENYKELLTCKHKGLNLFSQRNQFGEMAHILLPEITKEIKIKPRDWTYVVGKSDEGIEQPYIAVNIPKFKDRINIAPLFDVHFGNQAHRHEKFLSYIRWIAETENVYTFIGGDLLENALDDGRGMSYDQNINPDNQLNQICQILAPIAHKILFATTGNHEHRTYAKTGIDIMQIIADRLNIPYFSGPVFLTILSMGYKWNFYAFHGFGNSQTKGGKMNVASRPRNFTNNIHFFVSGHTHDLIVEPETTITEDLMNFRLVYMTQWTVVCPAFMNWENTYAYRAGYKPPTKGGVSIQLFDNGSYRASMTH